MLDHCAFHLFAFSALYSFIRISQKINSIQSSRYENERLNHWSTFHLEFGSNNIYRSLPTSIYLGFKWTLFLDFQVTGSGLGTLFSSYLKHATLQHLSIFVSWALWIIGVFMVYISSLGISQSWGSWVSGFTFMDYRQKRGVPYSVSLLSFPFLLMFLFSFPTFLLLSFLSIHYVFQDFHLHHIPQERMKLMRGKTISLIVWVG